MINDMRNSKPIDLTRQFNGRINSSDKILYLTEMGRIAQIQGDFVRSKKSFESAIQAIKESDQKAVMSASGAVAQASSVIVNDNTIPYKGDGYERVMLHHFQALNYLAQNDVENAGVEIRLANAEQENALKLHEQEIERAQESARKQNISGQEPGAVVNAYAQMDAAIGGIKSSFQNAATFYLSGVIYEALSQANDAYIDYKKALEIFPNNIYLQKDAIRLARQLNMGSDLNKFKSLYPAAFEIKQSVPKNSGELIVLFDDDFVAQKQQIKIPIPISLQTINFIAVAFPIYNIRPFNPAGLYIQEFGNMLGETQPICNLNALALKSLKEKVPVVTIRQLIRAGAKASMAKVAEKQGGWLGSLAASVYNVFSENADLRSWVTLPADVQIMRLNLSPGEHQFNIFHKESDANTALNVNIKEKTKTIVYIIRAGNKLYSKVML